MLDKILLYLKLGLTSQRSNGWARPRHWDKYRHGALDTQKQEIRLFKIVITPDDELEARIEHFNLENIVRDPKNDSSNGGSPIRFRALSYTWGPPTPCYDITVEGSVLRVRKNLADFLYAYAKRHPEEYIWIDQICINQDTVVERNHQVQLMSKIYELANEVIIWLGQQDVEGWKPQCSEDCQKDSSALSNTPSHQGQSSKVMSHSLQCLQRMSLAKHILQNAYWGRLWIIQEVMLARELRYFCGDMVLDANDVSKLSEFLIRHNAATRKLKPRPAQRDWINRRENPSRGGRWLTRRVRESPFGFRDSLLRDRNTFREDKKRVDIARCFQTYTHGLCEDVRDKVYGLQSLLDVEHRVQIDYEKTTKEVFIDAALKIVACGNLDSLKEKAISKLAWSMSIEQQAPGERGLFDDEEHGYGVLGILCWYRLCPVDERHERLAIIKNVFEKELIVSESSENVRGTLHPGASGQQTRMRADVIDNEL
ncbi:uncharacterized protein PV09_04103 [Verruconis gallopava]|uniref:Heterokaryon incompatibility domain-containing protein n=1 Tax=Verruconis gallopava TaxID=253628 RepID=A0A0D2ADB4_9PEZI|nr:uncharacterized protein PV09_04103 [Verruconis gallopava]KIW04938.1 hypothetical protein PV09_04103 [Verruconis gallopava]